MLCWDVSVTCPLANSYIDPAARESVAATELATSRKDEKYADLDDHYIFELIAIDTLGILNTPACHFLCDLGRKISEHTGEVREMNFLFQRYLVLM